MEKSIGFMETTGLISLEYAEKLEKERMEEIERKVAVDSIVEMLLRECDRICHG